MVRFPFLRMVLVGVIIVGTFGSIASYSTYGEFSDEGSASGALNASSKFGGNGNGNGGDSNPPGKKAYKDVDNNGRYNASVDEPVKKNDLRDYHNESADIVLSSNLGELDGKKKDVSITAKSIRSEVDIRTKTANINLQATGGNVDLSGANLSNNEGSGDNRIQIRSSGDVDLSGATITTDTQGIDVRAEEELILDDATVRANNGATLYELTGGTVTAKRVSLFNKNSDILFSAREGTLDARYGTIVIKEGGATISLNSNGTMNLEDATVDSGNNDPEADLSQNGATLYVDGTVINGGQGTLRYSPSSVDVVPVNRSNDGGDVQAQ